MISNQRMYGSVGPALGVRQAVTLREWFSPLRPAPLGEPRAQQIGWILRLTTASLLIGHGGFGAFMHKAEWADYFVTAGVGPGVAMARTAALRLRVEARDGVAASLGGRTPVGVHRAWRELRRTTGPALAPSMASGAPSAARRSVLSRAGWEVCDVLNRKGGGIWIGRHAARSA